jgi:predicted amidophosphoribosyltransferase
VAGRRLILLDDVITTGSTVAAAASALRSAGAVEVQAWSVARALA